MDQSVKPPRILFVRPRSAGSVRSRSQTPKFLAPTARENGRKAEAPTILVAGSNPPQPIRPVSSTARRPSSAVGSRRCVAPISFSALPHTAHEADNLDTRLWKPEDASGLGGGNIYHVIVARKDAEDTAQQLARRISHFRAQEERALREVKIMRTQLETSLQKPQVELQSPGDSRISQVFSKQKGASMSSRPKRKAKVPRSREQLDFLAKQKRALEMHKLEVARQQKERLKLALAEQQAKEAERDHERRCRKERIRAKEQQVIEQRIEKQRQLREAATKQHYERLMTEKQRQHEALNLIAQMEEEERNLRLRLEALHFHREYMEQELCSSVPPTGSHRTTGSD
ncbi:hypothetical protein V7S43_002653 [Phytophthora oleae]|uniref:Uncharacterized protein n=1 Tax=Phytophthora oleae TaxID=2107226 RepID=A0ABD3FYJ6_9STRA